MTDDSMIRIGRPPQAPPPAAEPPKRRRKELLIAAAAGIVLGVAVAGFYFGGRLLDSDPVTAPQVPMPSSPAPKALDVPATCAVLIPAALDGAQAVTALVEKPDGSTVDWAKVQKAHDEMKLIAEVAAPEMRDDITQQTALLSQLLSMYRTGNNMTLGLEDFRASGLRIGLRCKPYAS